MSDLMRIGASAVSAYRNALAVVGENVANAETAGYVRRTVVLAEAPATGIGGNTRFSGVIGERVQRQWDAFLAADARQEMASAAQSGTSHQWLERIETAMGNGQGGVASTIGAVFTAAASLSSDPASPTWRLTFLSKMEDAAAAFVGTDASLAGIEAHLDTTIDDLSRRMSEALSGLDTINIKLRVSPTGSAERAALEDRRDSLVDTLAAGLGVGIDHAADGSVTLTHPGSALPLIDARGAARLFVRPDANGRPELALTSDQGTTAIAAGSGEHAALIAARETVSGQRAALDTLAADSIALFNGWQAGGTDRVGNPGGPLLSGSRAADIALVTRDPVAIAAAGGGSANGNLITLAGLRQSSALENRWTDIVGQHAALTANMADRAEGDAFARDTAIGLLDTLTGVDLDREAADLLKFQQVYNGAARILQVARETIDAILAVS
jgi:flagellar hook-associated protein 1